MKTQQQKSLEYVLSMAIANTCNCGPDCGSLPGFQGHDEKCWVHRHKEDIAIVEQIIDKCCSLEPVHPSLAYCLGRLHRKWIKPPTISELLHVLPASADRHKARQDWIDGFNYDIPAGDAAFTLESYFGSDAFHDGLLGIEG
jgi:hypothetical protein